MKDEVKILAVNTAFALLVAAFFGAAALYYIRWMTVERFLEILASWSGVLAGLSLGLVTIAAMIVLLKSLSPRWKANFVLFVTFVVSGLYFAEGVVRLSDPINLYARYVEKVAEIRKEKGLWVSYDETHDRLQQQGYQVLGMPLLSSRKQDDEKTVPVLAYRGGGGQYYFVRSGYPHAYQIDEYGFQNPPGWHRQGLDAVLVGDSFVFGAWVASEDTIPARLREKGFEVLGLGQGGNGPLKTLATLMEYASPLKPKMIFWVYYEGNDLGDLGKEMKSDLYDGYLLGQRHGLRAQQAEIDEHYISFKETHSRHPGNIKGVFPGFLVLPELRNIKEALRVRHFRNSKVGKREYEKSLLKFRDILAAAKSEVEGWGGSFYFVYLPAWERYSSERNADDMYRGRVLDLVHDLNIPVVDMHKGFINTSDPLDLFPFRLRGHYNPEGYALVADTIAEVLQELRAAENGGRREVAPVLP